MVMKKDVKQITIKLFDERFYQFGDEFYPSVTYKLSNSYPKGDSLARWRGDVGNDTADKIIDQAGEDGSYVHDAIDRMIKKGDKISSEEIQMKYNNKRALKIHKCLKAFLDFWEEQEPQVLETEYIVIDEENNTAGTVDLKCKLKKDNYKGIWVLDWKTSKSISESHKAQVALYGKADSADNVGIVHLGNKTRAGYSFLPLKDEDYEKFYKRAVQASKLFDVMYPNARPRTDVFPEYFQLTNNKK